MKFKHENAVADLVEGGGGPGPPLFARNLPSNVSKTQNLRHKILEYFAISGGGPPLLDHTPPPFRNFGSATDLLAATIRLHAVTRVYMPSAWRRRSNPNVTS